MEYDKYTSASNTEKVRMMVKSIQEESVKRKSKFPSSWEEQIVLITEAIKDQVEKEIKAKIDEIEFYLRELKNNKDSIIFSLDQVDKSIPDVGNLAEVNELLDRLIYILKEEHEQFNKLKKIK